MLEAIGYGSTEIRIIPKDNAKDICHFRTSRHSKNQLIEAQNKIR
jgi:hypothetical protein